MSKLGSVADLQERLAIAERAITEAAGRIDELARALGEIVGDPEGEVLSDKPIRIGPDTVSPFYIGFYQREYDAADRPYRWTGRGKLFELRFRLNRNFGWQFSMELQPNAHVDLGRLRGYADYVEIALDISTSAAVVRGVIPPRPFGRQAVLTFLLPELFVPNQINPDSTDTRTLGVVFYELRALPTFLGEERPTLALARGMAEGASSEGNASTFVHAENLLRKARSSLVAGMARPKKLL